MNTTRRAVIAGGTAFGFWLAGPGRAMSQIGEAAQFIASYVGQELLKGAIGFAGGELLGRALGRVTLTDVRAWLREAVSELETFVSAELRKQLDDKVLEQIRADLDGVKENLHEYAALPPNKRLGGKYLLENADIQTARLIPLALNYPQALFVQTVAMGYRFITLGALHQLENTKSYIVSAKDFVDRFLVRASEEYVTLANALSPAVRINVRCDVDPGDLGGPTNAPAAGFDYCDVFVDGRNVGERFTDEHTQAPARRAANGLAEKLSPPVLGQMQAFVVAAQESFRAVIDCYSEMSKKVGTTYTPPKGLFPILGDTFIPLPIVTPIIIPGAVIIGR